MPACHSTLRVSGRRLAFAAGLILLLCGASWAGDERALLISSYHPGFPTFFQQINGIDSVLAPAGVSLDVEFMDSKRFFEKQDVDAFYGMLKRKLERSLPYGVVITADDNALRFVMERKNELFPGVPVVFCGVNNQELAHSLSGSDSFTGVIEAISMKETLDALWRLLPGATVYALADSTLSGQGDLDTFKKYRDEHPGKNLEVLSLENLTWEELGRRLEAIPPKDAILLLSAYRDAHGVPKSFDESLSLLLAHARAPVFHLWEHGLGQGLIGGKIISQYEQGRLAGGLALDILRGKAARDLPVIEGDKANAFVFDHNVLERFNLDEADLPEGARILNSPETLWRRYRTELAAILAFLLVLGVSCAVLFAYTLRLRNARALLRKANLRLVEAQEVGGIGDWDWDPVSNAVTWSENLYRILGLDPSKPPPDYRGQLALYHPESAARLEAAVARSLERKDPYEVELARTMPDGRAIHVLARGKVETDASGAVARLYGSVLDITSRKIAASELEAGERRYRQVVESIQETLAVMRADGTILFANARAASNLTGTNDPEAIIGKNIRAFLPEDEARALMEELSRVIGSDAPLIREQKVETPQGAKWFLNSLTPTVYGADREKCALSLSLDITEKMRLISHLEQYERAIESTRDMTAQVDANHIYVMANKAYLDWVGKSRDEVVGASIERIQSAAYGRIRPLLERALSGGRIDFCVVEDHPVLGRRYLDASYFPVDDEGGGRKVVAVIRDITGQKEAGDAYRQSEERFRLAFEQTAVGMCLNNLDGEFIRVNEALCAMTGYSADELLGMRFAGITHPDDRDEEARLARGVLEGKSDTYSQEKRCLKKNGETAFVSVTASALRSESGRVQCFIIAILDVTDQKRSLLERDRHTKHLQDILDATTDGIWEWDLVSGELSFSPNYYAMLGFAPGHFAPSYQSWLDLTHPEDRDAVREAAESWLATMEGVYEGTFRLRAKEGGYRWIESRAKVVERDEAGAAVRIIGNHADVTERKRAQQELALAHKRLSFHIENSPLGVIEWEKGTHIKMWSRRAESIFGWKAEEVVGKNWADFAFICPEDLAQTGEQIARLFDGRDAFNTVKNRNYRKDGSVVHCQWYNSPLRDGRGDMISILSQVADVTELKEFERNLLAAKEQAEAANKAKSDFLANMSHEIRTPLNGIIGMLQLLEMTSQSGEQSEYLLIAMQAASRLTRLLSDILDISRIEANRLNLLDEPFELAQVVENACGLFEATARQSGVSFYYAVSPDTPSRVVGDPIRLTQVLNNLLGNAFKFTRQGSVHVDVSPLPGRTPDKVNVQLMVSDTGIGIPKDKMGALFKPFSQVSEGYRREYQGAGLGLSICKQLVDRMGGTIVMSSEPGAGTTVHVMIPFARFAAGDGPRDDESRAVSQGGALRVLIAEDDAVNRLSAAKLLESAGHAVRVAGNGEEALSLAREMDFDVILMDVQMPVMDGLEATRTIREGGAGETKRGIPIVAMTAYAMPGDKDAFLKAGMDAYVAKPVNLRALQDIIETAAGAGSSRTAAHSQN